MQLDVLLRTVIRFTLCSWMFFSERLDVLCCAVGCFSPNGYTFYAVLLDVFLRMVRRLRCAGVDCRTDDFSFQ